MKIVPVSTIYMLGGLGESKQGQSINFLSAHTWTLVSSGIFKMYTQFFIIIFILILY